MGSQAGLAGSEGAAFETSSVDGKADQVKPVVLSGLGTRKNGHLRSSPTQSRDQTSKGQQHVQRRCGNCAAWNRPGSFCWNKHQQMPKGTGTDVQLSSANRTQALGPFKKYPNLGPAGKSVPGPCHLSAVHTSLQGKSRSCCK